MLAAIAVWSLFAFGGAYEWTLVPVVAGACLAVELTRPHVFARDTRPLDFFILICLAYIAFQLVPLPASLRLLISPALPHVEGAIYLDAARDPLNRPPSPLTVDPSSTAEALLIAAAMAAIFWAARAAFGVGSRRRTVRTVAISGAIAGVIAIIQHATAPKMIYWFWTPMNLDAEPYGPFVSRNDLAAWLVMALPLTLGYSLSRVESQRQGRFASAPLQSSLDDTAVWLGATICAMAAALLASLSRSGLIAAVTAMVVFIWLSRERMKSRGRTWLLAGVGLVIVIGAMYVNTAALMTRINETVSSGVGGRREIWATTRTIIGDFWRVGVGVGAFQRAMSVYQPPHLFAFNHAHDEYLQILAEGGVAFAAAVALVVGAGTAQALGRLRADRTPVFWLRVGALSGMAAIGVQNIWETGLRMPANAVLFALCAAMALHKPDRV